MEIRQLRYFLSIAETEHLTQSAHNLFVTQSTLSHGLRQLEQELNVALFDRLDRLGRGLKLSQAGAEFRVHATRALKEIEAGRMALADLSRLRSGKLTVGAFPTFLNTLLPATAASFSQSHPRVMLEVRDLRAGSIEALLLRGERDLGVGFHPTAHDEIETEPLLDERMQLVMRPAHGLARRHRLAMKELAGVPLGAVAAQLCQAPMDGRQACARQAWRQRSGWKWIRSRLCLASVATAVWRASCRNAPRDRHRICAPSR